MKQRNGLRPAPYPADSIPMEDFIDAALDVDALPPQDTDIDEDPRKPAQCIPNKMDTHGPHHLWSFRDFLKPRKHFAKSPET